MIELHEVWKENISMSSYHLIENRYDWTLNSNVFLNYRNNSSKNKTQRYVKSIWIRRRRLLTEFSMEEMSKWRDYLIQVEQSNFLLMLFSLSWEKAKRREKKKWEFELSNKTTVCVRSVSEWTRRKNIH